MKLKSFFIATGKFNLIFRQPKKNAEIITIHLSTKVQNLGGKRLSKRQNMKKIETQLGSK